MTLHSDSGEMSEDGIKQLLVDNKLARWYDAPSGARGWVADHQHVALGLAGPNTWIIYPRSRRAKKFLQELFAGVPNVTVSKSIMGPVIANAVA